MAERAAADARPPACATLPGGFSFALQLRGGRLELSALHRPGYGPICADWGSTEMRRRIAAGRRQPLARAAGLHKAPLPSVLDANAGLGRDGFLLAALGADVTLVERNATVLSLLRDAQRRALDEPALRPAAERLELLGADAGSVLASGRRWDVVYLDPMYPDDGKAALPSKEMQILRDLAGGDPDADRLLAPARACARRRVVVKRPLKAPWLDGAAPDLSLRGTQLRFDVYLCAAAAAHNSGKD
ncbi:MAG: class I SAM-dependent methyltransferase [Nevskia sp.]|nr:class I SAM-dependent methyltransferase [Nevskia sp.]